jgi:acyl CoA:acetate/3-ketoacid CoA transferase beta subunit
VVTELAVIEPTAEGLVLRELAPGVTVENVIAVTEASLIVPAKVPEMPIA